MAQQSPLNLNPQALAALLEVLTALNLNANNASASTRATTSASASAPASSFASGEGGAAPAPASLSPVQVPITSTDTPTMLLNPLTRGPLSSSMQAGLSSSAGSSLSSRVSPTQQPPAQVHTGFHCSYCGVFNPAVSQSGEVFYVVTTGHEVGIFTSWEVIQPLVSGVAHACHKKYKTCGEAEEAFQVVLSQGKCHGPKEYHNCRIGVEAIGMIASTNYQAQSSTIARIIDVDENDLATALTMVQWHQPSTQLYKMPQPTPWERTLLHTFDANFRLKGLKVPHWAHDWQNIPAESVERAWSYYNPRAMTVYRTHNPRRVFYLSRL
ncbi:hypothetical protein ARMSODRAFT_979582 [Armillaria solidipes]|uniref:Ribonuclease H1 N-terminal domain-containing protein n=1 Tax=Armillaria solidipes TaxID=1076256 RepID=A0A2H3BJD3_9AGAR|nr:hypothetical protein ARMSODRAFT_979582 [Armillaria solidipes]